MSLLPPDTVHDDQQVGDPHVVVRRRRSLEQAASDRALDARESSASGDLASPTLTYEQPRRIRSLSTGDLVELVVAATSGITASWLLCTVMDWSGALTFGVWALLWFLAATYLMVRDRTNAIVAQDRLVTTLIWVSGLIAVGVLVWMLAFVFVKGIGTLNAEFFTSDLGSVGPLDEGGGLLHALIGTLQQIAIATAISVPVAILTAVYLHEIKGRLAVPVRFVVDAMSGLPSIVAGLIVFTVWVNEGHGFSGAAAGVALSIMMIPIVTRTAEEILKTIDDGLRESALALGAPEWRSVVRVVLPTARSGLITASILGVARAIGETAPVLLTAFGNSSINWNPLKGPQSNLPLFIWQLLREPNDAQVRRAWGGALVLLLLVLVLFVTARAIGARGDRLRKGAR
ncbi:MAG: phosphate ABC transporter permease PstA [Actinomycetes bacterium]